jgi:hypothetical protein
MQSSHAVNLRRIEISPLLQESLDRGAVGPFGGVGQRGGGHGASRCG